MKPQTITDLLGQSVQKFSTKNAIICGDDQLTYGAFWHAVELIHARLKSAGFQAGDRVCIRTTDKLAFVRTTFAIMCCGGVAVPIDRDETADQAFTIQDSGARFILADDALHLAPADFPDCQFMPLDDDPAETLPLPQTTPDDPALILYTSGTHGRRKGVLLSHANLVASAHYIVGFTGLTDAAVELACAPIDHAFGFGRSRCLFAVGGTLVMDREAFNPIRAVSLLSRHHCNAISSVSSGYVMLLEKLERHFVALSEQLKWMEVGSLPMRKALMQKLVDAFPHAKIAMNYGMTEAQRSTLMDFRRDQEKLGSVGQASPGCAIQIRDEQGQAIPAGETGIIAVSGPHVAMNYWQNSAAWDERCQQAWFETDDLGWMDTEGFLYFVARRDDMINIGGEKVSPVAIEHLLQPYLNPMAFCICAAPDPAGVLGEVPALCLEGTEKPDGFSWAEIYPRLAEDLPPHDVPKLVALLPEFPRTGNGKIQRKRLKQQLVSGAFSPLTEC